MNKFELDMFRKDKVMRLYGGSAFRNKKKQWKAQYYKPYETDEERLLDKPDELSEAQWAELVHFWGTTEQQKKARQNEINRSKLEIKHTTARISFPRTIHEMEVADGVRPSQGHLFEVTHTSKRTRDALDNVSKNYISKMRALAGTNEQGTPLPLTDEHYHQVMPPERHGRVRGKALGLPRLVILDVHLIGALLVIWKKIQDKIDRRVEEKTKELESRLEEQMMEKLQVMMTKQFHSKDMTGGLENGGNETIVSPQVSHSQQYREKGALKKCKLVNWQKMVVVECRLESTNSNALVHHIPLGSDIWKVWVDVVVDPKASLWRMTSEMSNIEHAVETSVAWHKDYIVLI